MQNTLNALELREIADRAKYLYNTGEIDYEELLEVATKYIDVCNAAAVRIASEHGVKPRLMSVKAFLR